MTKTDWTAADYREASKRLAIGDILLPVSQVRSMLDFAAERIGEDERAVTDEVVQKVADELDELFAVEDAQEPAFLNDVRRILTSVWPRPPAQAAQVDPAAKLRTLADFVNAPDAERARTGQQVAARVDEMMAEPVAQGEAVDHDPEFIEHAELKLIDVWQYHRDRACNGRLTKDARDRHGLMAGVLHRALSVTQPAERVAQGEAVGWLVVDAKGKRFTIYNRDLAEAIKQSAEVSGSTLTVMAVCEVPPEGWYCTRGADHEGPCAAWPNQPAQPSYWPDGSDAPIRDALISDAQPAQEQPGWKVPDVVAGVMCDCWKVAHLFHSGEGMLAHVKRALDDAYASPTPPKEN